MTVVSLRLCFWRMLAAVAVGMMMVVNVNGFTTSTTTTTTTRVLRQYQQQLQYQRSTARTTLYVVPEFDSSYILETASNILADASSASDAVVSSVDVVESAAKSGIVAPPETGGISYSRASYYTILGL